MLTTKKINKSFFIKNEMINKNYESNIKNFISKQLVDTCTKEHGYIFGIDRIENKHSITLSRSNSSCVIRPIIYIKCFKPKVGDVINTIVTTIFQQGIFTTILNVFNCLIPSECLDDFVYKDNIFVNKKDVEIKTEQTLSVEITAVQYDKGAFNCIAKLNSIN